MSNKGYPNGCVLQGTFSDSKNVSAHINDQKIYASMTYSSTCEAMARDGSMARAAVASWLARRYIRQSEGSVFKSRSGQIAYLHGVSKNRLSTLGTGDVPRGSDST